MSMPSSQHNNNNNNNKNGNKFIPTVGVLCIDIAVHLRETFGNEYYSYIEASYVKFLESAGARVIPIWINRKRSYYEHIMDKINGILLPGGAVYFDSKYCSADLHNDCVQSSKYIFEIAKDFNKNGKHFPLWGTCMGFQLLLTHSADRIEIRQDCEPMFCSLPLEFENDEVLACSRLFGQIDGELKTKMSLQQFGVHQHKYCITKQDLKLLNIDQHWRVLATNRDPTGLEFITIIEHKHFPFFGCQIHPERVGFHNFTANANTLECFELAHYFGKFFVHQCSLNKNRFENEKEEMAHSIYMFPEFSYYAKNIFHLCYLFKKDDDYDFEEPKRVNYI